MLKIFTGVLILLVIGCANNQSGAGSQLGGCDSIVINFNTPQTNNIAKTVTTTEVKVVKKLAGFTNGKNSKAYECGYDGNMMFYKEGVLQGDFAFNYTEGCRHFIQQQNGGLVSTEMSNEAANFLKSLAEGKDWY